MEKSYFCEAGTVDEPCNWKFKSSKNFLNHMEKEHNITNAELPFPKKNKFELDSETKEQNENGIFYFCKGGTPANKCNRKYISAKSWLYHMEEEHRILYIALPPLENFNNAKAARRITNHKIQKQKSENMEMIKKLELQIRVLSRENKELSLKENDVKQPLEELKSMEHIIDGKILATGTEKCINNETNISLIPSEHASHSTLEKINNGKKQKSKDMEIFEDLKLQIRVLSKNIIEENQDLFLKENEVKRLLEELKSREHIIDEEILDTGTEKCINNETITSLIPCGHASLSPLEKIKNDKVVRRIKNDKKQKCKYMKMIKKLETQIRVLSKDIVEGNQDLSLKENEVKRLLEELKSREHITGGEILDTGVEKYMDNEMNILLIPSEHTSLSPLEKINNDKVVLRIKNDKKQKCKYMKMIKKLETQIRVLSKDIVEGNQDLSLKENEVKQLLEELKSREHITGGEILDTGVEKCIDNEMNILLIPSEHTSLSPLEKINKDKKQKSKDMEIFEVLKLQIRVLSKDILEVNQDLSLKENEVKRLLEELKSRENIFDEEILETGTEKCINNETITSLIPSEHTSFYPLEKIKNDKKQKNVETKTRVFSEEVVEVKRLLEELKSRGYILDGEILATGTEKCIVCIDNKANTAMLPCGHINFCLDCADSLKNRKDRCPMCRSPIKYTQRIFFS